MFLTLIYQTRIRKMKEIHAGDHVIAKHKNNRYYKSMVKGEKAQMFCHVEFKEDQSFCDNLYPEDIEVQVFVEFIGTWDGGGGGGGAEGIVPPPPNKKIYIYKK